MLQQGPQQALEDSQEERSSHNSGRSPGSEGDAIRASGGVVRLVDGVKDGFERGGAEKSVVHPLGIAFQEVRALSVGGRVATTRPHFGPKRSRDG